ncbi:MAG: PD40 domain-containing protein [Planctomycetes bacterium]|nr:PD40 domain-containing protein [Planctomycetota bacterium]
MSRVHPQGWGATWSPDGRMIAYINAGNGNVLMCYDLVEDEEFVVLRIQNSRIYSGFAWSPDSKSLAFCARTRGVNVVGRCDVLKRDTYQELRSGIAAQGIAWHPDGKRLLFASTTRVPFRLMTIPATPEEPGNQSPPQFIPGVPDTISAGNPVWSPDGKKIIFVATPTQ